MTVSTSSPTISRMACTSTLYQHLCQHLRRRFRGWPVRASSPTVSTSSPTISDDFEVGDDCIDILADKFEFEDRRVEDDSIDIFADGFEDGLSVPLEHLPMRRGAIYVAASGRCSEHWGPAAGTTLPKEQAKKESSKGDTYSLDEMRYPSEQR